MRSPAKPNPAGSIIDGREMKGQVEELGGERRGYNCLFYSGLVGVAGSSMDLEFDSLGGSLAGSVGDGEGISGCFLRRNIDAAGM